MHEMKNCAWFTEWLCGNPDEAQCNSCASFIPKQKQQLELFEDEKD